MFYNMGTVNLGPNDIIKSETHGKGVGIVNGHSGVLKMNGTKVQGFGVGVMLTQGSSALLEDVAFEGNTEALSAIGAGVFLKNCTVDGQIIEDLKGQFGYLSIFDDSNIILSVAAIVAAPSERRLNVLRKIPMIGRSLDAKGFMEKVRFIDTVLRLAERAGITEDTIKEFFESLSNF